MTRSRTSSLRGPAALVSAALATIALVACNGPTIVDAPETSGDFRVSLSMDPATLNPPQLATINYSITDNSTGKPVAEYAPVLGALFHNVLISRDLLHFEHSPTDRLLMDTFSTLTYFPKTGAYYSFGIFNPVESGVNVYLHTVQSGDVGPEPQLADELSASQVDRKFGLRLELMTGPEPLRAGQDAQIAFYVTELGQPVTGLWSYLDAPGYLWIIDEDGQNFTWEVGISPAHALTTTGTPPPSPTAGANQPTVAPTLPPPTFIPDLGEQLATRTAQPAPTLAPVQATAQASVLEPQLVRPPVTYGPYIAFPHRFPAAGLYKMWLEFMYRGEVIKSGWVVSVEP